MSFNKKACDKIVFKLNDEHGASYGSFSTATYKISEALLYNYIPNAYSDVFVKYFNNFALGKTFHSIFNREHFFNLSSRDVDLCINVFNDYFVNKKENQKGLNYYPANFAGQILFGKSLSTQNERKSFFINSYTKQKNVDVVSVVRKMIDWNGFEKVSPKKFKKVYDTFFPFIVKEMWEAKDLQDFDLRKGFEQMIEDYAGYKNHYFQDFIKKVENFKTRELEEELLDSLPNRTKTKKTLLSI